MVVSLNDWGLHRLVDRSAWLEVNAWALSAATLLLAGAYQFTPLKHLCLERCRPPLSGRSPEGCPRRRSPARHR